MACSLDTGPWARMARSAAGMLVGTAVLLLWATPLVAQEKGVAGVTRETIERERPQRWAVLIGINHYVDQTGIGELRYCVQDMKLLAAALTSKGGGFDRRNVLLMTDDAPEEIHRPTRSNILTQLPLWLEQAGAEDDVLIAFSGHGIFRDGKAHLLPSNARIANLRLTAIPLEFVREWLDACKAERKLLILDCCHAGAGKAPSVMDKDFLVDIEKGEGFVRLASCGEDQKSNEDPALKSPLSEGHGVFTYYLCKGLTGDADYDQDGRIDVDEAYRYAMRDVRSWAHRKGLRQDPLKEGTVQGVLTLGYRLAPKSAPGPGPEPDPVPPKPPRTFDADGFVDPPDRIVLEDGAEQLGQIVKETATDTVIQTESGARQTIPNRNIERVERPHVTFFLKNEQQLSGRITAKAGTRIMLQLAEGGTQFVGIEDVARTQWDYRARAAKAGARAGPGGARSAIELRLGQRIALAPVHAYLKDNFKVSEHGTFLVWQNLGPRGDCAYIFEDGRIVVVTQAPLVSLRGRDFLVDEAVLVTTAVSKVNAEVAPFDRWLGYSPCYYAQEPSVYKALSIESDKPIAGTSLRVDVPECTVRDARLRCSDQEQHWYGEWVIFDGKQVGKDGDIRRQLRFGSHKLDLLGQWRGLSVRLEAITTSTEEHISARFEDDYLTDCVLCRPIQDLQLPETEAD